MEVTEDGNPLSDGSAHMTTDENDDLHPVPEVAHFATIDQKKRLWFRDALIHSLFIAAWCVISTVPTIPSDHPSTLPCRFAFALVLSLYNKWMFAPEHFGFPLPLFVTMLHMFVQSALASTLRFGWPRRFRPENNPSREDYA